jgi:hypothetical protein
MVERERERERQRQTDRQMHSQHNPSPRPLRWGKDLAMQSSMLHFRGAGTVSWQEALFLSPQVQIKEETRLVSIIDQIDKAVAIIPRGALFKTPFGVTHVNRTFEGELGWICLGEQSRGI